MCYRLDRALAVSSFQLPHPPADRPFAFATLVLSELMRIIRDAVVYS
ncbi:hypothetical protein K788_0007120 (plasmid) [Paraburkholderia caribensis MBA4]|uniref:Uncharacterized protein n=1 Tax=Paraburkholderia caribensis MBA4 TaxID=1323664 RepID=A0A0P0RRD1_9BURK|nr:hypothetical protein K788_0007120 [Paraburkholderia caribensis MBA4]